MKSVTLKKAFMALLWSSVIFFSAYYMYNNCLRYFILDPEHYHFDFFWPRKYWVLIHVITGMTATIVSPFQFIPFLRLKNIRLHRLLGRTYVYSIIIASLTSLYLCATTPENVWYALGLGGFTLAWLVTAVMGMVKAINGKITQHKEWMTRSFVVTLGFSISRLLEDLIVHSSVQMERVDRLTILSWVSWIIPLLVTEWILVRKRKRQSRAKSITLIVKAGTESSKAMFRLKYVTK